MSHQRGRRTEPRPRFEIIRMPPPADGLPIDTAPIGGEDYFPPRTPGDEPVDCVLVWQPARARWPGGWRLGFWGGAHQLGWYDDGMALMKPQPTRWHPLPAKPGA